MAEYTCSFFWLGFSTNLATSSRQKRKIFLPVPYQAGILQNINKGTIRGHQIDTLLFGILGSCCGSPGGCACTLGARACMVFPLVGQVLLFVGGGNEAVLSKYNVHNNTSADANNGYDD